MKITSLTTQILRMPISNPAVTATITFNDVWFLLVELRTDDGAIGHAYIWSYNAHISRCLKEMVGELSRHAIGSDPRHSAKIWSAMWKGTVQWAHAGITIMASAVIDMAVWDLAGKIANQSVGQLLGLRIENVPTYASQGLWITDDLDALQREAASYVKMGFLAMKMRAGRKKVEEDIAAVRAVREAIGLQVGLMVDFGSSPLLEKAERMAAGMEEFNLLWIEDPCGDEDPADHAELALKIRTPVCFGEKVYAPQGFARIIAQRAADHLMADLQRAGGVTGWLRIAALADAARLPLSSHILPEFNVHLVASAPTGAWLEYMPWADTLLENSPVMVDGGIRVPDRPGFGLQFNADYVKQVLQETQTFS